MKRTTAHLKILAALAMLTAVSIVCGKYLAINLGNVLRLSFENLPVILAGVAFGPLGGALVGTVADLIGCVLVGYGVNPLVTVGAAAIGFSSGLVALICRRLPLPVSIGLSVLVSHLIGSVLIKTVGLAAYYDMPLHILMLWRLLNYTLVGAAEGALIFALLRNKMVSKQLSSIKKSAKKRNTGGTNSENKEKLEK